MISVVICTYNRADLLVDCLKSVARQSISKEKYEVLIIDNNSLDDTRAVAEWFSARYSNMHVFSEVRQGLSHARNRGWLEARGEYIAYIDDDCKVPSGWVSMAIGIIKNHHPSVFGGPFYPFYRSGKPRWYKDKYGSYSIDDQARRLTEHEFLFGGNIFFKRATLELLGGFSPELGMKGDRLGYGEEIALLKKLYAFYPYEKVYYHPGLFLFHLVRREKMYWPWIIKHRFITRRYAYRVNAGTPKVDIRFFPFVKKMSMILLRLFFETYAGLVKRDRNRYPYYQNYLFEYALRNVDRLGWTFEQYKMSKNNDVSEC